MNWRLKNLAFRVLETMPFGGVVYRTAQKVVTKRYYPKLTEHTLKSYMLPVEAFKAIPGATTALEFGAGRGLITPLLLSNAGAERVFAYDLQRLAKIEQVNSVIDQLAKAVPGQWSRVASFEELEARYRIFYRAPGDARNTGLADSSVDVIYSTATLEHIPPADIRAILREGMRILSPAGRMCFTIDYHDHYASSDRSIGYMNFYQFSADEWRRYNPDMHHQNRLRHSDYLRIFEEEGLRVIEQRPIFSSWSERDLARVSLHPTFQHYSHEDLTASNGYFLLASNDVEVAARAVTA